MKSISKITWLDSLKQNVITLLSVMLVISWAVLLTLHTVLLQSSCTPLLEWTDISARNCSTQLLDSSTKHSSKHPELHKTETTSKRMSQNSPQVASGQKPDQQSASSNTSKEIIALTAGSVAVAGLTVIGAPVVVVAGVGFALWLAARTVLSSGR